MSPRPVELLNARHADELRVQLLETALAVLRRDGARAFTLDAVARESKVSKGGLIHHFPNREALIRAMFEHVHRRFEEAMEHALASEPEAPGRFTRAYIHANFRLIEHGAPPYVLTMLELLAVEPEVLNGLKSKFCAIQEMVENDGLDPVYASILSSAADSCFLEVVLGMSTPNDARLLAMKERMLAMTHADPQCARKVDSSPPASK